ncbi:MAG: hypothetical protein U1F68_06340 [Gammaproteobacteria bacterium]
MEVFSTYMLDRFETRMVRHLRETFPDRTEKVSNDKLRDVVKAGMQKAEHYGIEFEDDVRRFLEYLVIYGARLDSKPSTRWLGAILRRQDIDGTHKMDLIDAAELQALREPP